MNASLSRVILNVHDVERLSAFYQDAFALSAVEHIKDEWGSSGPARSFAPSAAYCVADTARGRRRLTSAVITVDRDSLKCAPSFAKGVAMGDQVIASRTLRRS